MGRTLTDVRADGVKNVDMTFSKNLFGTARFQLRADVFNVFNRTQFGAPNGTVTNAAFGTVSTQANSPARNPAGPQVLLVGAKL